jgi:hypothetical protein
LKILNFTHSRRRAILYLERTPSFQKTIHKIFFLFEYAHFENQQWLEIMPIEYCMNGWALKLWALRKLRALGAHAHSSGLFIDGNLRAHALSWTE